jgi:hypothetical protein
MNHKWLTAIARVHGPASGQIDTENIPTKAGINTAMYSFAQAFDVATVF